MALEQLVDAYTKEPSYKVFINGRRQRDALRIEVNSSINDTLSSARVELLTLGSIKQEDRIQIQQGYNGNDRLTFTGIVDTITYNEYERFYTIEARDVLKKALDTFLVQEVAFGHDPDTDYYYYSTYTSFDGGSFHIHEYTNSADLYANHPETVGNIDNQGAKAEAVVQWLLHMSGLAEGSEIQVDNTNFYIGDLGPARFHMESVYDSVQRIAQLIGWRVYADAAGVARFRRRPRSPGGYTSWTYRTTGEPRNIHSVSRSDTNMDLRTYVEVRGASGISYTARGTSPYLGTTPYRGVLISNELIDTPGIAQFMGDRVLSDLNRLKTTVELQVDGNPILTPASTVLISSSVATGNFLLEEIQTTMSAEDGYKANLTCSTYPGGTVLEPTPSGGIVADFVPIQVVSFGDPKLVTTFDGSASYSDGATITQWSWTWPDSTTSVESDPVATFAFDQATISNGGSQDVTLTVTDSLGQTASVTKTITYETLTAGLTVLYRQLYAALTSIAAASINGGADWTAQSIQAISCAASNFGEGGVYVTSGYALFGTSNIQIPTGVYRTADYCSTIQNVLDTGTDAVTAVHVAELDSRYALAGTKAGKIYSSRDAGMSWTQVANLGYEIRELRHAYTNYQYILAVGSGVGNTKESFDLGGHFSSISAVSALDVNRESSGSTSNYYAHQTGVKGVASGTPTDLTFSGGATPNVVAITVAVDNNAGVMIVDSAGQHWNYDGSTFNGTTYQLGNKTRHNLRDGEVPHVVYYATTSGVYKSLDNNLTIAALYNPSGPEPSVDGVPVGWGKQVAYGPLAGILTPARLVLRGHVAGNDGLFVSSGQGWLHVPGTTSDDLDGVSNTTPGYVVWGLTEFNMLKLTASGLPSLYHNYATVPSPANGGAANIKSILISRKIGLPSGVLPAVYGLIGENVAPTLAIYRNFFVSPTMTSSVAAAPDTNFGAVAYQKRMPYNMDIVHYVYTQGLFAAQSTYGTYDGTAESFLGKVFVTRYGTLVGTYAFPGQGWFAYTPEADAYTTTVAEGGPEYGAVDLSGSSPQAAPTMIYDSSSRRGGVFVAYNEDYTDGSTAIGQRRYDDAGIYFIEGYGLGNVTQLLTAPTDYNKVYYFSVTHDRQETKDYLAAIFQKTGTGTYDFITRYSLDGGITWQEGPPINVSAGRTPGELFYVDSLDTN